MTEPSLDLPEPGSEGPITPSHILVTQYAAHAAMVNTLDLNEPAVPAVQLQIVGVTIADPANTPTKITLLLEAAGAHEIVHAIDAALHLLDNLANNQEGL